MITIQKLPTMKPEMTGALRKYIIRKRQRLKQEMEQDAIEERLKKEKEQKCIQDAMTLDQIKEQLSTLEKRLETLRSEKHDLFVQLKQVLNEGNLKRKQSAPANTASSEPDEQKRMKVEDNNVPEKTDAPANRVPESNSDQATSQISNNQSERISRFAPVDQQLHDWNQKHKLQSIKQLVSQSAPITDIGSPKPAHLTHSNPIMCLPSPMLNANNHANLSCHKQSELPSFLRHNLMPPASPASIDSQNLAPMHAQFGNFFTQTGAPAIPPELLMMSNRLNSKYQKMTNESHKLPMNPMQLNVPTSLSQSSDMLTKGFVNNQITGSPFAAYPNQFFIDNGLTPNFVHFNLLNHGLALGDLDMRTMPATSTMSPGSPNIPPPTTSHNKPLPHQISRTGLDYSSRNQTKPGPGSLTSVYDPVYQSQSSTQSLQSSTTSIYPGRNFDSFYQASTMSPVQQMGRPMRHHNLSSSRRNHQQLHHQHQSPQPPQYDQTSRISYPNPHHNKRPSPKNPYYPNRLYDND